MDLVNGKTERVKWKRILLECENKSSELMSFAKYFIGTERYDRISNNMSAYRYICRGGVSSTACTEKYFGTLNHILLI